LTDLEPAWDALIQDCFEHSQSTAALGRFFEAALPYLRAALTSRYYGDPTLVEDALQSAFLKFMSIFRETPKRPLNLGYFVVIAWNTLLDELRRRKGHLAIDELAESELPSIPAPSRQESNLRLSLIQHAITLLHPRCRFIIESYYINEVDPKELAAWLNVAPDSVHMAVKRCRDRLRTVVQQLSSEVSAEIVSQPGQHPTQAIK